MPRSTGAAPWDKDGARAAVRASRPALFIKQYLGPLFFKKTKPAKQSGHSDSLVNEEQFWGQTGEVLFGSIHLKGFRITDWFPRAPGLFWSRHARMEGEYRSENRSAVERG